MGQWLLLTDNVTGHGQEKTSLLLSFVHAYVFPYFWISTMPNAFIFLCLFKFILLNSTEFDLKMSFMSQLSRFYFSNSHKGATYSLALNVDVHSLFSSLNRPVFMSSQSMHLKSFFLSSIG